MRPTPISIIPSADRKMTASGIANRAPLASNAVWIDAAIGTLAAVARRNSSRVGRELPATALADQVNCDHGSDELAEREDVGEIEEQLDRIGREVLGWFGNHEPAHRRTVRNSCGREVRRPCATLVAWIASENSSSSRRR